MSLRRDVPFSLRARCIQGSMEHCLQLFCICNAREGEYQISGLDGLSKTTRAGERIEPYFLHRRCCWSCRGARHSYPQGRRGCERCYKQSRVHLRKEASRMNPRFTPQKNKGVKSRALLFLSGLRPQGRLAGWLRLNAWHRRHRNRPHTCPRASLRSRAKGSSSLSPYDNGTVVQETACCSLQRMTSPFWTHQRQLLSKHGHYNRCKPSPMVKRLHWPSGEMGPLHCWTTALAPAIIILAPFVCFKTLNVQRLSAGALPVGVHTRRGRRRYTRHRRFQRRLGARAMPVRRTALSKARWRRI